MTTEPHPTTDTEPAHRPAHPPLRRAAPGRRRPDRDRLRLGGPPARARRASRLRGPAGPHGHHSVRHRPRHRRALRMGHRRHRHRAPTTRGHRQPRHRDGRGRDRGLHRRGPQRGRAAALLRRRPRRVRRARPAQVPLRRPPAAAYAAQPPPQGPGQRGAPPGHGPPGLRRNRDPAALGPDPGGLPGVLGPLPTPPRRVLRAAPEPAAGQAAPHGGRLRPLLPDRPLPPGRGPQGRPPVRVHAARYGVLLRLPGRRHGLRLRSRHRRRRGGDGGAAATD